MSSDGQNVQKQNPPDSNDNVNCKGEVSSNSLSPVGPVANLLQLVRILASSTGPPRSTTMAARAETVPSPSSLAFHQTDWFDEACTKAEPLWIAELTHSLIQLLLEVLARADASEAKAASAVLRTGTAKLGLQFSSLLEETASFWKLLLNPSLTFVCKC